MAESSQPAGGAQPSGAAQPASQQQAGPISPAGDRNDSGKGESQPQGDRDAIWAEARRHYEGDLKKVQSESADLRKRLAKYEQTAKSAEQLQTELESTRGSLEKHNEIVKSYAESRVETLPEHLRGLLTKSSGGDALKTLELLPEFEDLARKTALKTLGGNLQVGPESQIAYAEIMAATDRGNTAPMREALAKLEKVHGSKVAAQTAYNRGLEAFMRSRGRG